MKFLNEIDRLPVTSEGFDRLRCLYYEAVGEYTADANAFTSPGSECGRDISGDELERLDRHVSVQRLIVSALQQFHIMLHRNGLERSQGAA